MSNIKNSFNIKKNESNNLLLEIVRQNISRATNEFRNNTLYLIENITPTELGEIIGRPVGEIIAFFWAKGQSISRNQTLS